MRVEVFSDVVCPWCEVGRANLDRALAEVAFGAEVEVVLRSFQLDPGARSLPPEENLARLARKYGTSPGEMRARQAHLVSIGAERGIDFRFDRMWIGPTFDAHRLLHLAAERRVQGALADVLGRAVFTDGERVDDHDVLRRAGAEAGLAAEEVDAVLAGDAYAEDVRADLAAARELDVTGVPFFVVDGRYAIGGAQEPRVLRRVLERAWSERAPVTVVAGDDALGACGPDGCET